MSDPTAELAVEEKLVETKAGAPNDALAWRRVAVASEPPPPMLLQLGSKGAAQIQQLTQDAEDMMQKVTAHLNEVAKNQEDLPDLMDPDADWSCFAHLQLSRVQAVNALGGPRMQIVSWLSLEQLGRFPRWPDDLGHVLDAEELLKAFIAQMDEKGKVDGRAATISMFSHCWERPNMDPSKAHPDTPDHKKALACAHYGRTGVCPSFEPNHKFDYYFWVDFAGIHQSCARQKYLGIAKLPAVAASCTKMIFYWSESRPYEPRCWTRAERMLGFCFTFCPLYALMSDNYPQSRTDVKKLTAAWPEVFVQDPEVDGGLLMYIQDPLGPDAQITDEGDKVLIKKLMESCKYSMPFNPQMKGTTFESIEFGKTMLRVDPC